ncbi:hypothetical protein ACFQVD_23465 [Streptosporangium amethystogenes subsp. fukuiense]|uniref:Lipoprotein n=1 Tax=Streptosporangium amethystogenes subsp. fukuiense TaxID=698418 RepID=A0ABW2T5R6_9ACTN
MIRSLLAAVLLLTGCSATAETTATLETTATVARAGAQADDVVVRFLRCGPMTCVGGDSLSVTGDGRAVSLRDGELVAVRLSATELGDLRAGLVEALAGREGTLDRTGGATDQPFAVITVTGQDGKVHENRLEGAPLVEDERIVAAGERLTALTGRIRATGTPDRTAPITVTLYEGRGVRPVRQASWPEGVLAPVLDQASGNPSSRTYRGEEAKALRTALGAAGEQVAVLVGGRTLIAGWEAELP